MEKSGQIGTSSVITGTSASMMTLESRAKVIDTLKGMKENL